MDEIEDVLDGSGPLLYMGSVLSESCEELEMLMDIYLLKTMVVSADINL